jgi:hypothetical protein
LEVYEWVDASKPQDSELKKEVAQYPKNLWVYWDPKFRQSAAVHSAFVKDLKRWCELQDANKPWVAGMDNLAEQASEQSRAQFLSGSTPIMPIFCPPDTTDLVAVTDCDLGRMEKNLMRSYFVKDFNEHPKQWTDSGVSARDWRMKLTRWAVAARTAMEAQHGATIVKSFKSCGFYNALNKTEDKLIKIRGSKAVFV